MCRVLMYKGDPVSIDDLLYRPNNSLVKQAHHPQLMDLLSLAGFGMLGWDQTSYRPEIPFGYRSVNIPVFDSNLKKLAEKLRVSILIAHVRGVLFDQSPTVGEQNLHPFRYEGYRLALAHNGSLAGFDRMRFSLLDHIKPEIAQLIQGNTDTEWIYALLLSQLDDPRAVTAPDEIADGVEKAFSILRDVRRRHDIAISSPANLFISDGLNLIAVRFTFDYGCYSMQASTRNPRFQPFVPQYLVHDGKIVRPARWRVENDRWLGGRRVFSADFIRAINAGYVHLVRGSRIQRLNSNARTWQTSVAHENLRRLIGYV